jgi:hypothetical protein
MWNEKANCSFSEQLELIWPIKNKRRITVLHIVLLIAVPTVKHSMMFRNRETVCYISGGYKLHTHTHTHTQKHTHTPTHMHTHAGTRMNTHACTHMHTRAHTRANKHTHKCTRTCTHTRAHTCKYTCIYTYTHTCAHTHVHTWTYTYTRTHMNIHIHTYTYFSKGLDLGNFLLASSQLSLHHHGGTTLKHSRMVMLYTISDISSAVN